MRFTHVELKNWKNFKQAEVDLANRVFLVGPNAGGKSNFLDVFRFLRDLVIEGGGLAPAVNSRGGVGKVRSLYSRNKVEVMIRVTVREGDEGWRYEVAFTHESVKNSRPVIVREVVHRISDKDGQKLILNRPDDADDKDRQRLRQTALEQLNVNQQFRDLADFFGEISYLHLVPQLLREEQLPRANSLGIDPFGRDLLDRIRQTPPRQQKSRLKKIENVLKSVIAELEELELVIDKHGRPHLQGKFQHWRPHGAKQNETQFSDGTLRLIGLLWALQEKAGPLLLEEPELSLHTAIVQKLAPFIYRAQRAGNGRQVLLSTHSEKLLEDAGIAPEEVLLVRPAREGSEIISGADESEITQLMQLGIPASQAILPKTETKQMNLFGNLQV